MATSIRPESMARITNFELANAFIEEQIAEVRKQVGDKKVLLARSICQPKHLHIWDEPMNYIDVISRMQIEELLLTFQPTILFVEHDKTFCDRIATKVVQL